MAEQPVDSPISRLKAFRSQDGQVNALIETPKGSRNKFKYEPELGLFVLSSVLPAGAIFPFDFGFIPATLAQDGDPLDILILMDEPAFPGCLIAARLIGVIEAQQTVQGQVQRNDRLIGAAVESVEHKALRSLEEMNQPLLEQIEHFFLSYEELKKKEFKLNGRAGPEQARRLVEEGQAGPASRG